MSENPNAQAAAADAIAEDDRREHQRVPASQLSGIRAQLPTGPEVILKDLSRSGARFQSESRLLPGLSVALKVVTPDGDVAIRGKVVRSRLVRLDKGGMGYEAAVAFTELLPDFESEAPAKPAVPPQERAVSGKDAAPPARPAEGTGATAGAAPASGTTGAAEATPASAAQRSAGHTATDSSPRTSTAGDPSPSEEDEVPMMLLVTACVPQTVAEIRELFNGNDW
ncbi:MAG: PilZ domain-containing protein [Vicinamibacterales bacterium]